MGNSLYSDAYLKKTFDFFKEIKEKTYQPFVALNDGIIADIGCGVGQDAENLAQIVQSGCRVIGLDHDQDLITQANLKNSSVKNLQFLKSDAGNLPFTDSEISGLRNERLIQHLEAPEAVYREFYRVLKPGAPAIFVETDWDSAVLYNGNTPVKEKLLYFLSNQRVANGKATGKLIGQLSQIGFKYISIQIFPIISYDLKSVSMLIQMDSALLKMKSLQMITEEEEALFVNDLIHADEAGCFAGAVNFVMLTAIK